MDYTRDAERYPEKPHQLHCRLNFTQQRKAMTARNTSKTAITLAIISIAAIFITATAAQAGMIAGADFSDAAVFNQAGGAIDIVNTDDLDGADNVTVTNWASAGGGKFQAGVDNNAQVGMPNDLVTKIDGDGAGLPTVGTLPADLNEVSFSINIPAGTIVDLADVTWDWRQATGSATVRWLAFRTSLDTNLIFSEVGLIRNDFDSETISLAGASYQGLTNQTVTFHWYAGGLGSGDIDIDTIIVNGNVTPEPATMSLLALGGLALLRRRRNRA
jgi:hypothetical protein